MGHQPLFFHPGIWMKYFLLSRLSADHHATGLHLIVDTDAPGPITAVLPAYRDRPVRVTETLLDLPEHALLEAAAPPTQEEWAAFWARVRTHLATVPGSRLAAHVDALAARETEGRRDGRPRTLGEALAGFRRAYETPGGAPGYLEVPTSRLADTPEFRAFVLHVLREPDALLRSYNSRLDDYRRADRLRSAANPFPNLSQGSGRIETPFWIAQGGLRRDLFVGREGDRLVLATADGPLLTVSSDAAGVQALADAGVALRPKAIMLTMFARLCLGDLFIHGVAGGRYDRVTDGIMMDLLGCRPPAYVVATATLHLPLGAEADATGERRALERRLMDLRHNPDRYLTEASPAQRRLVDEKWTLIRAVETMRPGSDRRTATRRIRAVNEQLADALAPEVARIQARLDALRRLGDSDDAVRYRGYAYFLFDPAEVGALAGAPFRAG